MQSGNNKTPILFFFWLFVRVLPYASWYADQQTATHLEHYGRRLHVLCTCFELVGFVFAVLYEKLNAGCSYSFVAYTLHLKMVVVTHYAKAGYLIIWLVHGVALSAAGLFR